jgi:hypothetical protein
MGGGRLVRARGLRNLAAAVADGLALGRCVHASHQRCQPDERFEDRS